MTERATGRLIVLEGIDGSGTTTQTRMLVESLRRRGRSVVSTREPSAGPIGRLLREILLGGHRMPTGEPVAGNAMALLFAADRVDHLRREIDPLLANATDVVSDRYLLSSLAYQAEETDRSWVAGLARDVRVPDLTILLDLPVEIAAHRRREAGRPDERYDDHEFLARVADNYRRLARNEPSVVVLDGAGSIEQVARDILAAVDRILTHGPRKPE